MEKNNKDFVVNYHPYWYQQEFHDELRNKQFAILNWSRRIGKTTACVNELCIRAITNPGSSYSYICPYKEQAKRITWPMFQQFFGDFPGIQFNNKDHIIYFMDQKKDNVPSQIHLYGADNDAIRGMGFDGVILDEYSDMKYSFWSEVVFPTIIDRDGFAIIISTPKGHNDFHRLYQEAEHNDDWFNMSVTLYDAKIYSKEKLATIERNAGEGFAQEFLVSFEGTTTGAIYKTQIAEMEDEERIGCFPYDPSRVVHTVWDLGRSDATSILFVQKVGNAFHLIEHVEKLNKTYEDVFSYALNKSYRYGTHFLPWDAIKHSQDSKYNALDVAKKMGMRVRVLAKNEGGVYGVNNGIKICRSFLPKLYVNKVKCPIWIDYMKRYRWEVNKDGTNKDKPKHDVTSNAADSTRYLAAVQDRLYEFNDITTQAFEQPKFESIDPYYHS